VKISVCITTYNGEKYIKEQIDSIICQLSSEDEIIISDDGSTDSTISIISQYKDKRISIILEEPMGSPVRNIERALIRARGDIIFLSDQDDVWLPDKVRKSLLALKDVDLVCSDAIIVDKDLNQIAGSFHNKTRRAGVFNNLFYNHYLGATMAFRTKLLNIALPFPENIPMHDQWLGLLGEIFYKTRFIDESLILYRRHGNNASYSGGKSQNSFIKKVSFRLSISWALAKRVVEILFKNGKK
jgi:glycosyltransferase involved in cell wall biosynthesis